MKARTTKTHSHQKPLERAKATPHTVAQYNAKSEKFRDTYGRVLDVLSKMRSEKTSLQKAAQETGISPRTVKRWAGSILTKQSSGEYVARKRDNLLRVLVVPTKNGKEEIGVRGSRQASLLGKYWAAVQHYLQTGDFSRVEKFKGKTIKDASGAKIPLLTDRAALNRLGSAGVLSFESLYARST